MPEFTIEYKGDHDWRLFDELRDKLATLASDLFTVEQQWPLSKHDISFKFYRVVPPSTASHDIIVRAHLHHFKERVENSNRHALLIKALVVNLLDNAGYYLGGSSPSVGVSLTYGHVAWVSGSLDDHLDKSHLDEVERIIARGRYGASRS